MARTRTLLRRFYKQVIDSGDTFPSIALTGNGVSIPDGQAIPSTANDTEFGDTGISSTVTKTYTIHNNGNADLHVTAISVPSGYTLLGVSLPLEIEEEDFTTFQVRFDAGFLVAGYTGDVVVTSDDPVSPTYNFAIGADLWALYAAFQNGKTAEIGTLTYNEVDGSFQTGKAFFNPQATAAWGDQSMRSQLISMLDDIAHVMVGTINESIRHGAVLGWYPSTTIADTPRLSIYTNNSAQIMANIAGTALGNTLSLSANTDYPSAIVARDTDSDANAEEYQAFVKPTDNYWHRLWVLEGQNDASMYGGFSNLSAAGSLDNFKVKKLASSLFDPSVNLAGSQSAGQTWSAPDGDFVWRFTVTTRTSATVMRLQFRKQDANNHWYVNITNTGELGLYETIAGVANLRAAAAGVVSNGSVVTVVAIGASITIRVGLSAAFNYTTAHNFVRETSAELNSLGTGGVISDIKVWKYYLRNTNGLGSELVVNGDFASDTAWTKGTGWTISGGTANQSGAGAPSNLSQALAMVVGRYYEVTVTVTRSAGNLTVFVGSNGSLAPISANGTYTFRGVCVGATTLYFQADASFVGSVDNVSCKEILFVTDSLSASLDAAGSGSLDADYVYFDEFLGASPALGTRTLNEVDGIFYIQELAYLAQVTPVWGDQSVRSQLITMLDDVAMVAVGVLNEATRQNALFGWWPTTTINANTRLAIYTNSANQIGAYEQTAPAVMSPVSISAFVDYPMAVVARDTDSDANAEEYQAFAKISGYWTRFWTFLGQNDASMYAGFSNHSAVGALDNFKVKPLASSLFAPPVDLAGSVSAGTTWTAPDGDFIMQFINNTIASGTGVQIHFRKKDASNYWIFRIETAGSGGILLYEVVAGVLTLRGSGSGATNGDIFTLIADGATIRIFRNTTQAFVYTAAYNFIRETGGELNSLGTGGVVSNIQVWKRYLRNTNGLGSELAVNGSFTGSAASWTLGSNWTYASDKVSHAAGSSGNLSQASILTVGKYYELTFTVSNYSAGNLSPILGSSATMASITANGTYTYRGVADGTSLVFFATSTFVGDLDDVSCKEILFTADSLAAEIEGVLNG